MEDDGESALDKFKSFTGCKSDAEASQLLEACEGDMARAVDLYFQQRPAGSPEDPQCSNSDRQSRRSAPGPSRSRPCPVNGATRRVGDITKNNCAQREHGDVVIDEEVRAPIAPVRGPIVEQSFRQQYEARNRRSRVSSVFDSFRDYRGESEDYLASFQNGNSAANGQAADRRSLHVLFRPPLELIYRGDWELARAEAQRQGTWLMVNIQNVCEFACQTLNRDVWSNPAVKELLRSNFLFWQIHHDSADGQRISNYYRIYSYPAIFAVDPRTGELLTKFRAQDAVSFCDQVTTFLDTFPDFAARDRHLIGATAPASFSESAPSKSAAPLSSGDEGPSEVNPSPGVATRKRASSTAMDEGETKKSRIGESMPDVDSVVSGVSKATTVDEDEWRGYVGKPDGLGSLVSLLLRLPDGNRQSVQVQDTTPLRAVFMLIAGLGFSPCEHLLVLSYPKREYSFEDADRTLRELQLNKRELIHVETK